MNDLQKNLEIEIDGLNALLLAAVTPEEEERLRDLRKTCYTLWEQTIQLALDQNGPHFTRAVSAVMDAAQAAARALDDIERLEEALEKASLAILAVSEVLER